MLLVTAECLVLLIWGEGGYIKQKFNVANFGQVLQCLEMIQTQTQKFSTEWDNPGVDILHMSESMQNLKMLMKISRVFYRRWEKNSKPSAHSCEFLVSM